MARGGPVIRVEGAKMLRRTLKKSGADMKKLSAVNRKAATVVANAAKPTTPRLTGKLAASVRTGATQRAGIVRAGRKTIPYANAIHWGWPSRRIPPQPWVSLAAQSTEPVWVDLYLREMKSLIKEVKGK